MFRADGCGSRWQQIAVGCRSDPVEVLGDAAGNSRLVGTGASNTPRNHAGQHPTASFEYHHWTTAIALFRHHRAKHLTKNNKNVLNQKKASGLGITKKNTITWSIFTFSFSSKIATIMADQRERLVHGEAFKVDNVIRNLIGFWYSWKRDSNRVQCSSTLSVIAIQRRGWRRGQRQHGESGRTITVRPSTTC